MFKFFQKLFHPYKNVMAPKFCWRTSEVGAKLRYLKDSFIDLIHPNKAGKEFSKIMAHNPNAQEAQHACDIFESETGIKMLMTNPEGAISFNTNANIIIRDIKEARFPKDIKYIVIGHGTGTVINDTWRVMFQPEIKILDFIDKHIPKGEKVLVQCCESTPKEIRHLIPKDKPAIGKSASEMYSSYKHPAKIVISGQQVPSHQRIVGGYGNGIVTYYPL